MELSPTKVCETTAENAGSHWKPNLTHEHLFVVMRAEIDEECEDLPIEDRITGTKAFLTQEEAIAEVDRLNQLNASKGCRYFWRIARLGASEGEK